MSVGAAFVFALLLTFSTATRANPISIIGPFGTWGSELQQAIDMFTQRTGIEVEIIQATSWPDLYEKVVTMSAAGVPPDIIYGDNLRTMDLASLGLLAPPTPLAERGGVDLGRFPAVVLEALSHQGVLYALPTGVSLHAIFYNVDLLEQAGADRLPTHWAGDDLLWDEFVNLARQLTRDTTGDGTPNIYGISGFGVGGFNHLGIFDAEDVDPSRSLYQGNNPRVINALEQMSSLWLEHQVVGGNISNGTAAMHPAQAHYLNTMLSQARAGNEINWRIGIMPKGSARASQAGFHSLAMSSRTSQPDAAWELLKFLAADVEGATLFTRAENRVPVLPETGRDFAERWMNEFPQANIEVLIEAINFIWDWRIISGAGGGEVLALLTSASQMIQSRETSVQGAIERITPQMNQILRDAAARWESP